MNKKMLKASQRSMAPQIKEAECKHAVENRKIHVNLNDPQISIWRCWVALQLSVFLFHRVQSLQPQYRETKNVCDCPGAVGFPTKVVLGVIGIADSCRLLWGGDAAAGEYIGFYALWLPSKAIKAWRDNSENGWLFDPLRPRRHKILNHGVIAHWVTRFRGCGNKSWKTLEGAWGSPMSPWLKHQDCHVAPRLDWHKETIQLLKEKSRRLVIPMIGALNIDTWDEVPNGGFVGKCWVNFNADTQMHQMHG